jgi:branched-chain amino acid transport system substrate-binding protein
MDFGNSKRGWASRAAVAAMVVAAAVLLAACGGSESGGSSSSSGGGGGGGETIKLGSSNVISGPIAAVCKPITDGVQAVFDKVNEEGGVNGKKIEFEVLDDQYDPGRAASNARKTIEAGSSALVAGCGTTNEQAAWNIAKQKEVPMIGPLSNMPEALEPPTDSYFGLFPTYGLQDAAAVIAGMKLHGPGSVVHITENIPGVEGEDELAEAGTEQAGGEWLGDVYAEPTETDFTPVALKVKAMHPDYVLFSVGSPEAAQLLEAFEAQGFSPNKMYLASTSSTDETLLATSSKALEGKFFGVSSVKQVGPETEECDEILKKYASSSDIGLHGLYGCSVGQVVVAALENIKGEVTPSSLAESLNEMKESKVAPAFGTVSFSPEDHAGVTEGTGYEIEGGKFVEAGTAEFAEP